MSDITPSSSSTTVNGGTSPSKASLLRATKRKFEDALQIIDSAVDESAPPTAERPSPSKKFQSARSSIYSTLTKYGIRSSENAKQPSPKKLPFGKPTPHLSAILARSASRARTANPFRSSATPPLPLDPSADYRPSSTQSFLARLATFKLATYSHKPPGLDAVAASRCGWTNDGRDRLICGLCKASWVVQGRDGLGRDAAHTLIEKQKCYMVDAHKDGCPWRTRQCDASIYHVPLQAPLIMARHIKANAVTLDAVLTAVEVKHPLPSHHVGQLRDAIFAVSPAARNLHHDNEESIDPSMQHHSPSAPSAELPSNPSDTSILASLFGWSIASQAPPPPRPRLSAATSRVTTPLASRASTPAPPIAVAGDVSATSTITRTSSLVRMASRPSLNGSARPASTLTRRSGTPALESSPRMRRDATLLHCALCQRRVGLWAFAPVEKPTGTVSRASIPIIDDDLGQPPSQQPMLVTPTRAQRHFDLLKEHRSFCPYVVRSTIIPSFSNPNSSQSSVNVITEGNKVEGWRAVLSIVLRYGRSAARNAALPVVSVEGVRMEVDGEAEGGGGAVDDVRAMVTGVKKSGAKDVLKYVKGLLG